MAAVLYITLYLLFCLLPFIQAEYCYYNDYNDGGFSLKQHIKYCSGGCCTTGTDATLYNVCCYGLDDEDRPLLNTIIGVSVGVACIISIVVVIVIISCCCCKRRTTQGHVIAAPNTTVVYSNSAHPGVTYPPQGTNNPASPPTAYSDPPPSYGAVASSEQDKQGFQTHVNMN